MAVHSLHTSTALVHAPSPYADFALNINSGTLTLDSSYEPYIRATLVVSVPDAATMELLTPLTGRRVRVTVEESFGTGTEWNPVARPATSRAFELLLVGRTVNRTGDGLTLDLTSDETLLQLYRHPVATTERTYGLSVKTAVAFALAKIGATLAAGADDANLTSKPLDPVQTNLIPNPSFEAASIAYLIASGCALSRVNTWSAAGSWALQIVASSSDSYAQDNSSGMQYGMQAGHSYVLSATGKIVVPGTGATISVSRQRGLTVFCYNGSTYTEFSSSQVPNYAGAVARVSLEFTVPADTTAVFVRYYLGTASGTMLWDALRLSEKLPAPAVNPSDQTIIFDGSTNPDSGLWTSAWTGTVNASTSTLTAKPNTDATIWRPGTSASDWLEPILQQSGLHLWADESRAWQLRRDRTLPDLISISPQTSVTDATDSISLANESEYYDHVVLAFTGNLAADGSTYTTYDVATSGTYLAGFYKEYDTPQPGVGGAANILTASLGKGRVFALSAVSNYLTTPGQNVVATIPDTPLQTGRVKAVSFDLATFLMSLDTQGLTTTPANAWVLAVGPWTAATGSWVAATGTN